MPTQPGHPVVRPYLSRMLWRRYNLFARLPTGQIILWLDRWSLRRTFCCRNPRAANTTQVQELQVPSAITLKTSHTTCLCCSCWRQDSSHPPHVQFGSFFRIVSCQADLSKWHNFSSVVLEDYDMAFSQTLSLENCSRPMHRAEPSHPSAHVQVQFLSCISMGRLPEKLAAVPEL